MRARCPSRQRGKSPSPPRALSLSLQPQLEGTGRFQRPVSLSLSLSSLLLSLPSPCRGLPSPPPCRGSSRGQAGFRLLEWPAQACGQAKARASSRGMRRYRAARTLSAPASLYRASPRSVCKLYCEILPDKSESRRPQTVADKTTPSGENSSPLTDRDESYCASRISLHASSGDRRGRPAGDSAAACIRCMRDRRARARCGAASGRELGPPTGRRYVHCDDDEPSLLRLSATLASSDHGGGGGGSSGGGGGGRRCS